jgi:hypothetical protein
MAVVVDLEELLNVSDSDRILVQNVNNNGNNNGK